jgi:Tfp pilus assembly protein PilN
VSLTGSCCQDILDNVELPDELRAAWSAVFEVSDPLEALAGVGRVREALTEFETRLARDALATGATWATIGQALGISRQAAWERLRGGIAAAIESDRRAVEVRRASLAKRRGRKSNVGT